MSFDDAWDPQTTEMLRGLFRQEAKEHLTIIKERLDALNDDPEMISEALRHAHTLKGSSGTVGYHCTSQAAHLLEEKLLFCKKSNELMSEGELNLLISSLDILESLVTAHTLDEAEKLLALFSNAIGISKNDIKTKEKAELKKKRRTLDRRREDLSVIRVDAGRIDTLSRHTRQLIANTKDLESLFLNSHVKASDSSAANQLSDIHERLGELVEGLAFLDEQLRDVRMMSIRWLFTRLKRSAEELSKQEEKQIRLDMRPEELLIDRRIIERISDPMIHLLRNSIAHGLESPACRKKANKRDEGTIDVRAEYVGDFLQLKICDDGRGIDIDSLRKVLKTSEHLGTEVDTLSDEEVRDCIFLAGVSTRDSVDALAGRGMGLDVVYRNIAELGGNVQVHSVYGEGTSFTIMVPREIKEDLIETKPKYRVLVVDDSLAVRESVAHCLSREGFHVERAADGAVALAMLYRNSFDLMITDLEMPRCSGQALIESCRKRGMDFPIIVLTSLDSQEAKDELLALGADLFLGKDEIRHIAEHVMSRLS